MLWFSRNKKKISALLGLIGENQKPNTRALADVAKDVRLLELNVKSFGYDLALRLAQALPVRTDTIATHIGLKSKASTQNDIESEWAAHWSAELKTPVVYHRKLWEFAYVLQALHEHGQLTAGTRGLGFGCGVEPIPSYLASKGIFTTVTDLPHEEAKAKGWVESNQHLQALESAFHAHLVSRDAFDSLVEIQETDMNRIPATLRGYDFCWSICALEHLGSIQKGLDFIENSLDTLRPGGLSVHTMEFNVEGDGPTTDNWMTVLFQRKHLEFISCRLREKGHWVADLDFDMGDKPMDKFIDVPPWTHDMPKAMSDRIGNPYHLKLGIDGFIATCFGIIVRKAE